MQIAHLSTNDFGGAAIAAMNLHRALLHAGVESDLLTLGRTRHDIPRHHLVDPHALHPPAWLSRGRYKALRLLERTGLADDRRPDSWNKHLRGRPPGRSPFHYRGPSSMHSAIPSCNALTSSTCTWVSRGMIDYVRFFEGCGKPVVWTLHDMDPLHRRLPPRR
ncbi:MAG: hypothetical protein IPM46_00265 [Flavobacteriales bacterium]|nr:hypothetical protein [Flavobacteriales bacterium]